MEITTRNREKIRAKRASEVEQSDLSKWASKLRSNSASKGQWKSYRPRERERDINKNKNNNNHETA